MVFCNIKNRNKQVCYACHNPYFSRWFSAIKVLSDLECEKESHNPYFSRWFSAMLNSALKDINNYMVTILILVDGFLQSKKKYRW